MEKLKNLLSEKLIIFIFVVFIIILGISLFLSNNNTPLPAPMSLPAPTPVVAIPTETLENLSPEDQAKIQTEADRKFSEKWEEIYANYPWFDTLPLHTENYFVFFNPSKKIFVVDLYTHINTSISIENQIVNLKKEILKKLTSQGVDTSKYSFRWTSYPR